MYGKAKMIPDSVMRGLKSQEFASTLCCETSLISLQKGFGFSEHSSPRDALPIMLEGDIYFSINHTAYQVHTYQSFQFPA